MPAAWRAAAGLLLRTCAITAAAFAAAARTAFAGTPEHLHFVGDDVGAPALDAFLVGVLAAADRALDVHLPALLQVFAGDLRQPAEEFHAVPFGALLRLAGLLVFPVFRSRKADRGDGRTGSGVAGFRVRTEIADQDDLVDAASHGRVPRVEMQVDKRCYHVRPNAIVAWRRTT